MNDGGLFNEDVETVKALKEDWQSDGDVGTEPIHRGSMRAVTLTERSCVEAGVIVHDRAGDPAHALALVDSVRRLLPLDALFGWPDDRVELQVANA